MISSECVQCTPAVNLHNVNKLTFDPLRMCTIYRNLSQYTPYNNNFHLSLYMCIISTSRTCVPCSPMIFPILAWLCCTCLHVNTFCACVQVYTCCTCVQVYTSCTCVQMYTSCTGFSGIHKILVNTKLRLKSSLVYTKIL